MKAVLPGIVFLVVASMVFAIGLLVAGKLVYGDIIHTRISPHEVIPLPLALAMPASLLLSILAGGFSADIVKKLLWG